MKKPSFLTARIGFDRGGAVGVRDAAAREAARLADLAVQYEGLLDQVWRCEREWKLDDRIAYACRTRRR
jgi:hypothetical protein